MTRLPSTVIALGLTFSLGVCDEAMAHAHLKTSVPAGNATLAASPASISLQFSEALLLKFSGIKVTGPGNAEVKLGPAASGSGGDSALEVPVTAPLPAGLYTVDWHIVSNDGHKMKGTYTFTVKP